jgi:hypothetical protein
MHHADAHLLLVLLGPAGRARHRSRDSRREPGGNQAPGRLSSPSVKSRVLADSHAPAEAWISMGAADARARRRAARHVPCRAG